jgi:TalC/MipB family fructose-6-phosphate aldolase
MVALDTYDSARGWSTSARLSFRETRMALYIDSARRDALEPLLDTGLFDGIATNPTLLSRAELTQQDLPDLYTWAVEHGAATVFMQTLGTSSEAIVVNGAWLGGLGRAAVVKVPATTAGLTAARQLVNNGARVLVTAVYHPTQVLLAEAAGAHYIAPYVGRMTDHGRDGVASTTLMQNILTPGRIRVLAASLRSPDEVAQLAAAGVADFAVSCELAQSLLADELTVAAAAEFELSASGGGT